MTTAIGVVFPKTRYLLCIWHIRKNSKKDIMGLRSKQDFVKLFNHILKNTDTYAYFFKCVCLHLWVGDAKKVNKKYIAGSNVWRRGMLKKFSDLIFASELNVNAQECVGEGFRVMKDKIIIEVGPYYVDNLEIEGGSSNVKDPVGRQEIVEIKYNQEKGKRKGALTHASKIKTTVQLSMNNEVLGRIINVPGSEFELNLGISNCSDVKPSSNSQTFINFM
ncbi:hypothetical protein M9H77_14461 [Catharanthus roseus]|uniref:Uncharacterized protein n=1 Tax=Catharanthus roseus TaxID=4058 RepID=A0ACC0BNE0_CATRO|nr:hypothetical protein M9H77_14461 [Catharanthus roseus]